MYADFKFIRNFYCNVLDFLVNVKLFFFAVLKILFIYLFCNGTDKDETNILKRPT